jgi:hypothetical protein
MHLDEGKPKPLKQDEKAPELLEIVITDKKTGEVFMTETVQQKHFSTGSVGYYCGGKMTNPQSGERYQISCNIALIGSKPK